MIGRKKILARVASMRISKRLLILFAYILCGWFIFDPGPLPMALFVFVAQPCLALAAFIYILEVIEDLSQHEVL